MTNNTAHTRPEFFRLPTIGPDPHFGLSRATYYRAEAAGDLKLHRIRQRGKNRGVTLLKYDEVSAYVSRAIADQVVPDEATPAAAGR